MGNGKKQLILNYKSYYEAFSNGVVKKGYKPVADILFKPLFDPHTICDQEGNPYEINAQNANAWGKGQEPIPTEIQSAVGKAEWLEVLIKYFEGLLQKGILSDALKDEMLETMIELVSNCDIPDGKCKKLIACYNQGRIGEFLARLFQRALLGNNKVTPKKQQKSASDKSSDSLTEFDAKVKRHMPKPKTIVPKRIKKDEMPYVSELYKAYETRCKTKVSGKKDLEREGLLSHFEHQRRNYYQAETIHRELRDSSLPNEADIFDVIKDEIEEGIYKVRHEEYEDAVYKVNAVTDRASDVILSENSEEYTYKWMGPGEKKGVCHMLVNDERLKWVDDYE